MVLAATVADDAAAALIDTVAELPGLLADSSGTAADLSGTVPELVPETTATELPGTAAVLPASSLDLLLSTTSELPLLLVSTLLPGLFSPSADLVASGSEFSKIEKLTSKKRPTW